MLIKSFKFISFLILSGLIIALGSCAPARLMLQQSPKFTPKRDHLALKANINQRETYKKTLQKIIFGPIPEFTTTKIIQTKSFPDVLNGLAQLEQWEIEASFGGAARRFHVAILRPNNNLKAPMILSQNFCPNHAVIPIDGLDTPNGPFFECSSDGFVSGIFGFFFGRYITTPPLEDILNRGYSFAALYPHEFAPDSRANGRAVIAELFPDLSPSDRPGTLAIWGAQSIWLAKHIKTTLGIEKIATFGHSRFGKTALIAAAYSDDIDAAIAHQSGTGGASIMRDDIGESIEQITQSYPHWFSPRLDAYGAKPSTLPVDAQHLLALIAPRPILLGNARRDVWSDPNGAFLAAEQVSPIWQELGKSGLTKTKLNQFDPSADIAFWQRPGTHGVVKEDWPAFLDFLDAHFMP